MAAIAVTVAALAIYAGYASTGQTGKAAADAQSISNDGGIVARGMLSLIVVAGLMAVIAVAMRRMRARAGRRKSAEHMQVLNSVFIGSKKQIVLMRVMNRVLVLGVTEAAISKLAEFPDASQHEDGANDAAQPGAGLVSLLDGWRR
jgi:flagellar biosynthetic protein FliO